MSISKVVLLLASGAGGAAVLGMLGFFQDRPNIVLLKHGDYEIEVIRNSETLSQAMAINAKGSIIGLREVAEESNSILSSLSYFCGDALCVDMPIPDEFTNVEAVALSDNDLVVGFASRVVGHADGSLRAVVWNPHTGKIDLLPRVAGDETCHAQSISASGTRITGYSTGPGRLRPVLWSWNPTEQTWGIAVLETEMEYNPYLMSSTLQISPDGSKIAGCCTEQILPGDIIDSSLYIWTETDGTWTRKHLNAEQLYIEEMNDQGEMAGSLRGLEGRLPCFVSTQGEVRRLELLSGHTTGEARGINQNSQIVGWCDQPHPTEGGTRPCAWNREGKVSQIELSDIPFAMVNGINDAGRIAGMMTITMSDEDHNSSQTEEAKLDLAHSFRARPIK